MSVISAKLGKASALETTTIEVGPRGPEAGALVRPCYPVVNKNNSSISVARASMPRLNRFLLPALLALALAAPTARAADLVLSITEGITYYQTNKEIQAKFAPLADLISKAIKRPVRMVIVSAYAEEREGLDRQEYDLAFIHPAQVALAAIKSGKYRSVAWTTGYTDYSVMLLANKDQPITKLEDLRVHTIVRPDPDSITARELRAKIADQKVKRRAALK